MNITARQKANRKAAIYKGFALFFLLMQLTAYSGEISNRESANMDNSHMIGYFIGISLFLYISLIFFYLNYKTRKKIRTMVSEEDLDGIGQNN